MHATGSFEVKMTPQPPSADGSTGLGRMTIDKELHGAFEGTSKGEMLTALTSVKTSAGYVAIERLTGSLDDRQGTFVLIHRGIMTGTDRKLEITIVPDSGTEQLTGISGTMSIDIDAAGKHTYDLEYSFGEEQ